MTTEHTGCPCALCREPMPNPEPMDIATTRVRQAMYEFERRRHRVYHPLVSRDQLEQGADSTAR